MYPLNLETKAIHTIFLVYCYEGLAFFRSDFFPLINGIILTILHAYFLLAQH